MELRQIYEELQGDYASILGRLITDERIIKYLLKFLDKDMDAMILKALEEQDYEAAFREAHNLKGICANLSLDKLGQSASELTEALRGGEVKGDITPLVENLKADYEMTVRALQKLK